MKYRSTRNPQKLFSASEALEFGLAPDGGLFVPQEFPKLEVEDFDTQSSYSEFAFQMLAPFFKEDVLASRLQSICKNAFNFQITLRERGERPAVLELFHGPTAAFKDVGARFLAECFAQTENKRRTVLVATSGDTGGAVAGAFFAKKNIDVIILFPLNKVSARQEKQLTAWGENVRAFAVRGSFDDCQKVVKDALSDREWQSEKNFISANSISIGRLLPQMVYYAKSSLEYLERHRYAPGYIIPTGNLGNAVAALWAKRIGFPIREVVLSTNANRPIPDFIETGFWQAHPTLSTLANAMDVGNPSNVERLRDLYAKIEDLRIDVRALSVSDQEISNLIRSEFQKTGEIFCPHTATALVAAQQIKGTHWIAVSTAHPAKFESIVEPLIQQKIEVPETLQKLLSRPSLFTEIAPTLQALKDAQI